MDNVNVLYCFDSNSWKMAAVSIESLLLNANTSTQITIYCLVAPRTNGYRKIKRIVKSHKSGKKLVWKEITAEENPFEKTELSKYGSSNFIRCIAHRFCKDTDKILYLSNDTLIYHDLAELFLTDIEDYAFAAVYDMAPVNDVNNSLGASIKDFSQKYLNNGPYYNSGVLLLNLKQMAQNEHLLLENKTPLRYPEQDLLNTTFVGKIKTLPLKYNLAPGIGVPSHFTQEEAAEINSGKHVIVNCYYSNIKAYDKTTANKVVYGMFEKCAKNIGINPEIFMKSLKKQEPLKNTFIPHIKTRGKTILFFGIEIK